MSLLFIREVNYGSLHATSHLSSIQYTKCATWHLHIMHLATCHCMKKFPLQLILHKKYNCLTCITNMYLGTKVGLTLTISGLDHQLSLYYSQSRTWTNILDIFEVWYLMSTDINSLRLKSLKKYKQQRISLLSLTEFTNSCLKDWTSNIYFTSKFMIKMSEFDF